MRCNPGGLLDPADVVGRDAVIERLWEILERQSILLTAERRMGKTSVLRKMELEGPADRLLIRRDLEKVHTLEHLIETVYEDIETHLTRQSRVAERTRRLFEQLSGTEVKALGKLPQLATRDWKAVLGALIADLVTQQQRKLVLLWDEFPIMLENIRTRTPEGPRSAMELLDTLRSLRQEHPDLRMILTGSIGLHHVVTALKRAGYANSPVNDLYAFELPSLSREDAAGLARRLLAGKQIVDRNAGLPEAIAAAGDDVPFYIHHLVDRLPARAPASTADVEARLWDCLSSSADPWDLAHFRDRLRTYYGADRELLALRILDALALADAPLQFTELFQRTRPPRNREAVLEIVTGLCRDHYLARTMEGAFSFRLTLLCRWWRFARSL